MRFDNEFAALEEGAVEVENSELHWNDSDGWITEQTPRVYSSFERLLPLIRLSTNVGIGSKTVLAALKCDFRSTPINGHHQTGPVGPVRARARSRCAPARCAGAGAERPAAGREDSDGGPTANVPNPRVWCTCSGSTGMAMPITR
jgi:hypothetical protein